MKGADQDPAAVEGRAEPNTDEAAEASKPAKQGRLARHARMAQDIYAEPRSAGRYMREGLIAAWTARGAGFYGLGWICAFIALEVDMLTGEIAESESVGDFVGSQMIEYLLRIGFMSFVNGILAALWPVYLLQWWGAWGLAVLLGGYLAFERLLRPGVEAWLPELKAARIAREEEAAAKAARKAEKKAEKKAGKKAAKKGENPDAPPDS